LRNKLRPLSAPGQGQQFAVEWNSELVKSVDRAFANVVADAGLGDDVTPHDDNRNAVSAIWPPSS
jgi:hypothetical protein